MKGVWLESIGLYGGTFNPIHFGHLRTAWEIKEEFDLNTVFFIPAALPPHKQPVGLEDSRLRIEMIRLAIGSHAGFEVSDVELKRTGPSYTIDTVKSFRSSLLPGTEMYFIIGSDAFLEIHTWKSFKELLTLISFIVMVRPAEAFHSLSTQLTVIEDFLKVKISDQFNFDPEKNRYIHTEMMPVYVRQVTPLEISSTQIRDILRSGKAIKFLVPEAVEKYIHSKGLYQ